MCLTCVDECEYAMNVMNECQLSVSDEYKARRCTRRLLLLGLTKILMKNLRNIY